MVKLTSVLTSFFTLTAAAVTVAASDRRSLSLPRARYGLRSLRELAKEANDTAKTTVANFANSSVEATLGEVKARDGTTLNYVEVGNPAHPTMVLVHGWLSAKEFWNKQLKDLVDGGVHVIAFDQRNHGASGPSREINGSYAPAQAKMSVAGFATDLYDLISALGLDEKELPIMLVGHSMGGMVILKAMEIFGREKMNVGGIFSVDSTVTPFGPASYPEEERLRRGIVQTNSEAEDAIGEVYPGPKREAGRLDMYLSFFSEDLPPEERKMVEEYVAKAPLEPSVTLFYSIVGAVGGGDALADILINNVLGAGVDFTGVALCPSTIRGYKYMEERKNEAGVKGQSPVFLDLSAGFPDDHRRHFTFWNNHTVSEQVNEALVEFAANHNRSRT